MDYLFSYLILASIFVILGLSTNLLVGVVGIFSVSQAAIFGVGAYTVGYALSNDIMGFVPALALAAVVCLVLNVLITLPSLRVSGDYFVVTSFGIQLLATAAFTNWDAITGGASGMAGIPTADLFGLPIDTSLKTLILTACVACLACFAFRLVMRSPFGRLLMALREDELAVAAAGRQVLRAKVEAAALAGVFAGVAGGLYAVYLSFIDPSTFDLDASVLLLTMVVLGGARTLAGSIVGPFVVVALPQLLSLIDLPTAIAASARQGIYGVLLVAFMLFRPQGLMGRKI
ncbi:branched-chain amino acid ABC transporter permease [Acidisoma cellulosilytica]|uniref:Branched-chain amino acid ABC transporter permease n=1 Tax=Acidisoma cellulosilyticum TaxID=2802395 RepID=A0A964E5V9_9PROT|nr:branched-chain amino acid ABC transporter permease [Acidisoma cellulosilyticum]MCB8883095.1 branched-chain amino acid ABC transporter permease [Acidisoma cellulosilyticum]